MGRYVKYSYEDLKRIANLPEEKFKSEAYKVYTKSRAPRSDLEVLLQLAQSKSKSKATFIKRLLGIKTDESEAKTRKRIPERLKELAKQVRKICTELGIKRSITRASSVVGWHNWDTGIFITYYPEDYISESPHKLKAILIRARVATNVIDSERRRKEKRKALKDLAKLVEALRTRGFAVRKLSSDEYIVTGRR